ncbi:MAG TPA: helix-turn-helix transcriptional regulator, partial [Candidatus Limnocylindrales bacterium]|nr:helix-turn-helix transcriptional regulator [Candidatus Limnocylindrales bacterium]
MDDAKVGRLFRAIRQRRGWRQVDLATKAGISSAVVSYIENGQLAGRTLATIRAAAGPLGLSFEGLVRGPGADLDRVLDARHAALLGSCAAWLAGLGWTYAAEVTYSEWGERGSVDLLAWHARTRTLLVVEIKTELVSVEETLRKHGEKERLAAQIARPLGWNPLVVSRLLVFPEDRTQRRRVLANESVMRSAYPARATAVKAWCR